MGNYILSQRHVTHHINEIKAQEAQTLQTVQLIEGIVGNSKCIKFAQHLIILTICREVAQDKVSAQQHLTKLWQVLDAIKINIDLYLDIFYAAVQATYAVAT